MFITPELLLWTALVLSVLVFGFWFLNLYVKDRDKRKLMFSIAFFANTISFAYFVINMLGIPLINATMQFHNLYAWGGMVFLLAMFIAIMEGIIKVDFDKIFLSFVFVISMFFAVALLPINLVDVLLSLRRFVGLGIIIAGTYQIYKTRSLTALMFLISLICFIIFNISVFTGVEESYLSIFSAYMAHIFILFTVIISSYHGNPSDAISPYFSLREELDFAKRALKESEERYRIIVENTNDVIMLTTPEGIISYMSPSCKNIFGYVPGELKGKEFELVYPDDVIEVKKLYHQALSGVSG
ncbi:MAG TPA: PAS domain S-box protein, partial [Thermoplasmatales archaeon]|nr:PAS domain S-box protein [Thermoplasmatales archaeon]